MESQEKLNQIERKARNRQRVQNTVIYIFLTFWGIMVLFPFYWMILTSVKDYGEYNSEFIPKFYTLSPTFQNYRSVFTEVDLGRYLRRGASAGFRRDP